MDLCESDSGADYGSAGGHSGALKDSSIWRLAGQEVCRRISEEEACSFTFDQVPPS